MTTPRTIDAAVRAAELATTAQAAQGAATLNAARIGTLAQGVSSPPPPAAAESRTGP
jgi:hypothetical protein